MSLYSECAAAFPGLLQGGRQSFGGERALVGGYRLSRPPLHGVILGLDPRIQTQALGWRSTIPRPATSEVVASELIRHLYARGAEDDGDEDRQEEQDHRHRQLRRQGGSLFFRGGHALVAAFLRQDA